MQHKNISIINLISILLILLVNLIPRLYHIDKPIADWHSWRQVDTAAVARNFIKFGLDPLRPRYDDLSNIQTGKDNPTGYRMVEFPDYQIIAVLVQKIFHHVPIEVILRLISIIASTGTAICLSIIVSRHIDKLTGWMTGILYGLIPYNIYFGRTILPDVLTVFWAVLSICILDVNLSQSKNKTDNININVGFFTSALFAALSILTKPTAVFILIPIIYIFIAKFKFTWIWFVKVFIYGIIVLFPLWWWRLWILQFPEGIPVFSWLFNEGNIRFKGAWFYWLFAERLGKLILGYWGIFPLVTGFLSLSAKKEGWLFKYFALGVLLYFIVIARGNVQHDYYQIIIMPAVTIYLAKGFGWIIKANSFSQLTKLIALPIICAFAFGFSWYTIRSYFWVNHPEIIDAGIAVDKLVPKNAKVIAPYSGDTTFLYQTNRQGWPIGFEIPKKMGMGATYYVTVASLTTDFEAQDLARRFTVISNSNKYTIIDLTRPK
jgi:hypothetical protein